MIYLQKSTISYKYNYPPCRSSHIAGPYYVFRTKCSAVLFTILMLVLMSDTVFSVSLVVFIIQKQCLHRTQLGSDFQPRYLRSAYARIGHDVNLSLFGMPLCFLHFTLCRPNTVFGRTNRLGRHLAAVCYFLDGISKFFYDRSYLPYGIGLLFRNRCKGVCCFPAAGSFFCQTAGNLSDPVYDILNH